MTEEEEAEREALHRQIAFAYAQNRELVFEIHARDRVISDLQNRLAELEDAQGTPAGRHIPPAEF